MKSGLAVVAACLVAGALVIAAPVAQAAPRITTATADATVFSGNWIVGDQPLGEVVLTFDEEVIVPTGAVTIYTRDNGQWLPSFQPVNTATTTLTIDFSNPISVDRVTIILNDGAVVGDASGVALDGETGDPRNPSLPSGDGQAGGYAVFQYSVLQGDITRDGVVNLQDGLAFAFADGTCVGETNFNPNADLNGSGCVDGDDEAILLPAQSGVWQFPGTDTDDDGAGDSFDNCVDDANTDQDDIDGDDVGTVCDNCPTIQNEMQVDSDDDETGDDCDVCPGFDDRIDPDGDDLPTGCDNCPNDVNTNQLDVDTDGVGDACDNCPDIANADQKDDDNDDVGNVCDVCTNGDDNLDADTDGLADACDNCPQHANANQEDKDEDKVGDACDNCPDKVNTDQADDDNDGVGDACDVCPGFDDTVDLDTNGVPDGCDPPADADDDGVPDSADQCPNTPAHQFVYADGCSWPQRDDDDDGVLNSVDKCAGTPAGADVDTDGCSSEQLGGDQPFDPQPGPTPPAEFDADGDSVHDDFDACPNTPPGVNVLDNGCPIDAGDEEAANPLPDDGDGECGNGVGCGAFGTATAYLLLLGLGWLKAEARRGRRARR